MSINSTNSLEEALTQIRDQHTEKRGTIYGIHNIKEIAPKNQIGINYAENKLKSKNEIQMRQTPQRGAVGKATQQTNQNKAHKKAQAKSNNIKKHNNVDKCGCVKEIEDHISK